MDINNKTHTWITVGAFVVIFILLLLVVHFASRARVASDNVLALQDTLHTVQLKNGALATYTKALVVENGKLSKSIEDKDGHIAELEKKVGRLQSYTKVETVYEIDSIMLYDTVLIVNGRPCTGFGYQDDWLLFEGLNCDSTITLEKLRLATPLEVGLTEDNSVVVTSPCPYLKVTDVKTAVKAKKKYMWNVGFQAGFGCGYDIIHKTFGVGPYVGVGIACGFDF